MHICRHNFNECELGKIINLPEPQPYSLSHSRITLLTRILWELGDNIQITVWHMVTENKC